ncbi:uncharacterized protein LOC131649317 [Vicia villosa]|uniref:uncharacterized protein LOC131649317 n=1 Tax=Vicia villosa TaxID=3911 RepID=UPI00273B807D|nr:uncharacterized protein LOC131649317 [Vicia villosa]
MELDDVITCVDGRNIVTIATALEVVAQAMLNQPNAEVIDESRSLSTFQRENPSTFKDNAETAKFSKCIKFESRLRPKIKQAIGYQQIRRFTELVNNCRIYEEDNIAHSAHYKSLNEKRIGYHAPYCKDDGSTCFNYGEQGHISTQCQTPKKDANAAKTNGGIFALSGVEDSKKDNLIRGTCFINNAELVTIIDIGATHSSILLDCATMLGLNLSSMDGSRVIDTPASGFATTTFVCKGHPLIIFDKSFVMDLVCLPLHQINVILGMNWLEFNYVHINCYSKTLRFPLFGDNGEMMLLAAKQSLQNDREATSIELSVVCEFLEVFLNDISDFPPECEVELSIELVSGTSHVSMAPYRMSASEHNKLKK